MTEAIIVDAVRTARGKRKGALSALHPVDLLAQTLTASLAHAGLKPQDVDDVIIGCVTQVGEQGLNIARGAVLAAGLPIEVPGTTVNRFCGSGLQAVNFGAQAVLSGASQLVVAGGVEHMTRVPMGSDALGGEGPASPGLQQHWPDLVPQGLSAELIAAKWGYSREKLGDIDLFEINEAFAPVPLVVAEELGIPLEKVNVNGGAIALGHPLGATGAMLLATALHELERTGQRRALITLCIGYGMGISTIIDRKFD